MKRVISFVLVLALVLGSFSMAFAAPKDVIGDTNEEAITVANDLGIITGYPDGTYKPDQLVTRAEYAAMIVRALAIPESALAGYTTTSFNDTSGYGWAVKYLAFCNDKGIMLGDGQGNAMPGRTIDTNEAVTMGLRAIGYTNNSAVLVGVYPANYVTLAQNLGLYDDVESTGSVDRAAAAQIIYNILTVGLVQVDADGQTTSVGTYDVNNGNAWIPTTLLTSGLGCDVEAATVIEGDEESLINLTPYKGVYAVTYTKDGDIVAVGEVKSTALTGTLDLANGTIDVDGTEYKVASNQAITAGGFYFNNGYAVAGTALNGHGLANDAYVTLNVELKGKTVTALYSVAEWTVDATVLFEEEGLDDESINGYALPLDDDDVIDTMAFELNGVATLEDIEVDDLLEIYLNPNTGKISKIEVGTESVTGKITKINSDGDKFTIEGTAYDATTAFIGQTPGLGDEGTAYLNINGEVAYWDEDVASAGNYAVLVGNKATSGFSDETTVYAIKLFTAEGTEITPNVDGDVTAAAMAIRNGTIVEYSLNKDGEVDDIKAATTVAAVGKVSKDGTLIGTQVVASNVVVFVNDSGDYSIGKLANMQRDTDLTADVVKNTSGKIAAVLVNASEEAKGEGTYGVINTTYSAVDADDADVIGVEGFLDGKELDALGEDDTVADYPLTTTTYGIAKITLNADGVVTEVTPGAADMDVATTSATTVTSVSTANKTIEFDGGTYQIADDSVIYVWNSTDGVWEVKTAISALKGKYVKAYTTDEDAVNGFDIIMAW